MPINVNFKSPVFNASLPSVLTNGFAEIRTAFQRVVGGRDYRSGLFNQAFAAVAQIDGTITFPGAAFADWPFVFVCPRDKFPLVDCTIIVRATTLTNFNFRIQTDAPYTGNIVFNWIAFL